MNVGVKTRCFVLEWLNWWCRGRLKLRRRVCVDDGCAGHDCDLDSTDGCYYETLGKVKVKGASIDDRLSMESV